MDVLEMWDIFFDHPSYEDDEDNFQPPRKHHIRIPHFFEDIVVTYSLTDFKSHFRVEKTTFEQLVQILGPRLHAHDPENMPPDKQIAIALWFFGNQEVYRSIADRFGISKDTVWRIVFQIAMLLTEDVGTYIKWPETHEMIKIEREFRKINGFPGVIGVIDGSHIAISAPTENSDNYINRKGYHSIVLQGICDYKLRFIDVFTGMCGSVHDARVWRLSDIKQLIAQNENIYFQNMYHLLADSAYPLSHYMLTPYRDNGHLNNLQINFNTKLSKTRVVIERAFGMLKGRFRKLKYIYMYNTEMIPLVILTCCILHNICIENEDEHMEFDAIDMEDDNNIALMDGIEKRDLISNLL